MTRQPMAQPSRVKVSDALRQMARGFEEENNIMLKDGYEFRYEQTDDEYRLQGFYGALSAQDARRSSHGGLDDRPAWLTNIVDVALVAGAVSRAENPPPDFILWFRTDKDYNLKEYVEI